MEHQALGCVTFSKSAAEREQFEHDRRAEDGVRAPARLRASQVVIGRVLTGAKPPPIVVPDG
jgi:hypothetical protein